MRLIIRWSFWVFMVCSHRGMLVPPAWGSEVDFVRDVQPILAEYCTACHGADAETRQAGLRLDAEEAVLRGGDSGEPAVVPGDVNRGTLLSRITSQAPDLIMPPADQQHPLTPPQIETLKQWVAQGAPFAAHWAFVPPEKPQVESTSTVHPLDALVDTKLAEVKLTANPPAASEVLCRRLYLDIIGLPPTLEELAAFAKSGVAATAQQLLASPRFGEKWARHWLDAARYSDTNGYEKDLRRDQWIWRDWVIEAFNQDMPYDQFVREQIAGDLLPEASQSQMIATGFLRNSMLNEEGAIIPEQFRMVELFDRMDCIGKSIMGLTIGCAQCHNHKFDPLSQTEYYGLFAFLNDTYEAQSWVYTDEQQQQLQQVHSQLEQINQRVQQAHPDWQQALADFAEGVSTQHSHWRTVRFHQLESISGLNHPVQLPDASILMLGHTSGDVFFVGDIEGENLTGLSLEALPHRDLPFSGPGRNRVGGWEVKELEVFWQRPGSDQWEKQQLTAATADFSEALKATEDGKRSSGPVPLLIDGKDEYSWKADRGLGRRNQASQAVVQFAKPVSCPPGTKLKVVLRMGDMLGCARISLTSQPQPRAAAVDHSAVLAAVCAADERSPEQQQALFSAWRDSLPDRANWQADIEAVWKQYPEALTSVLHLAQRSPNEQRTTHLLARGEWDQPLAEVTAHVPAAFHPLEPQHGPGRLGLANWLVDRRSPLAARVAVNRVWQAMFGEGLVETSEDFGTRAPVPVQLAVLDWLAVDFMEHNWSHKHLIETIVNSQTYQRSSQATLEQQQLDPQNRYLARGPRFRADAEVIRDMALAVSGLITHRLGGPSVIPPVPENVLNYNYVVPNYWKPATGPERYRRAVYGFRKRSMPDPAMSTLDAPTADFACARRSRSNSPLAALVGLNETVFVEAARGLALRILSESAPFDRDRIEHGFKLCTTRRPSAAEIETLQELLVGQRQRLADGWLDPRAIAFGDAVRMPDLPTGCTPQDAAAWTLVARVLLNLDETLCKN